MSIYGCQGKELKKESLARYTTWRVGGMADLLYKPLHREDLICFLKLLPKETAVCWLGLGSNTLIRDGGFSGIVILTQGALNNISLIEDGLVKVEAGVSCASVARFCARNSLKGGEFWAGIPGTIGGALHMNAGCFHSETWEYVVSVEMVDRLGNVVILKPSDFHIAYREVKLIQPNKVNDLKWFISATIRLPFGDKQKSLYLIKELLLHRAKTQPIGEYNCGSVFKNPSNAFAGQLIEECGLKGFQLGGAVVSPKHANFIINQDGKATALDIEELMNEVKNRVLKKKGICLVPEIRIVGEY